MQRRVMGFWFPGVQDDEGSEDEALTFEEWMKASTSILEVVVDDMGARRWEEEAIRRKWRWTGHVIRRGGERPFLNVLKWEPAGRKRSRRGAPKQVWESSFVKLLGQGWEQATLNRDEWKAWAEEAVNMYTQGA